VKPHPVENQLITSAGHAQLVSTLRALTTEGRQGLAERLREARADGNLEDNPALFELLEEQAQLEQKIAALEVELATVRIAPRPADGVTAVGSVVRVRDLATGDETAYQLVGSIEADPASGRVSIESPVGQALLGRRAGEQVTASTPRGLTTLAIAAVDDQVVRAA
jgi:transcription elongation factor GreA